MRKFILGVALATLALPAIAPAQPGQPNWSNGRNDNRGHDDRGRGHDDRGHGRDDRGRHDNGRGGGNFDWNRPDPRYGNYDASRYYRQGNYQERRLGRNDRIYRGSNGRYYCRRSDGTTGLIVGALAGGLLGNSLDGGRSSTLGTLLGAGGGALLGQSIDKGNARCR
jgi:hypothetical protein